jgi:cation transport regulator ChaB
VVASEGTLEEGRSEWGNLPPRIREILSQSRRDRVSALYQQATEAYYRRLAEERKP